MKIESIVEVISAAHLSHLVNVPQEFSERGGLMFIAPTGQLKTVVTKTLDLWQPHAIVLSDITIRQLVEMRGDIAAGKVRTLGFMEFPKLYSRNPDVASNVEGALQQMVAEGWRAANYEDQRLMLKEARAMVVGAMPPAFYAKKWGGWTASGFSRRFLWCHFQLADSEILMESIDRWTPLDLGKIITARPASGAIPFNVTQDESATIRSILRRSKSGYETIPFILLKKIFAVIKWRHSDAGAGIAKKKAMEILMDFSQCIRAVADVQLDIPLREDADNVKAPKRATGTNG